MGEGQWAQTGIKGKISNLKKGLGKMAKNQSLPAYLQEKDSRGEDHLTLYERHEKPTAYRSRPSLSNPRSTNDIVRAVLRANSTLIRSATNRDPTIGAVCGEGLRVGAGGRLKQFLCYSNRWL